MIPTFTILLAIGSFSFYYRPNFARFYGIVPPFYRISQGFSMGLDRFLEVWWVAQNGGAGFGRNGG
jgi:hypothetical protein